MRVEKSKSGRVLVTLDGYSEYYHAFVQGEITGKVSFPPEFARDDNDLLITAAKFCLRDGENGTENRRYYGAKIICKKGVIR